MSKVEESKPFDFERLAEQVNKPLQLCKTCGTNIEFYQCFCNSTANVSIQTNTVAITSACELGEHCRCTKTDRVDCWNLIGKVTL